MKRLIPFSLILSLLLLLQGCPKPWAINLYNNTSENLVVRFTDGQALWASGTTLRLLDEKRKLKWVPDEGASATVPELQIERGAETIRYKLKVFPIPPEYLPETGVAEIYLRLESDGNLYAVKPGQPPSTEKLLSQPPGFPIKPSRPDR